MSNTVDGISMLQVKIVPPDEWMLDQSLRSASVRLKIENGVLFLKPSGVGIHDIIEIEFRRRAWWGTLAMPAERNGFSFSERILSKLMQLGFNGSDSRYFEMTAAQRGWHCISLRGHRHVFPGPSLGIRRVQMAHAATWEDEPQPQSKVFNDTITAQDVEWALEH